MDLLKNLAKKDPKALTRLISMIENQAKDLFQLMPEIYKRAGGARILGITGPPGAGKSTLVSELIKHIRNEKKSVAVLAVDPSSPFTGGAVLGDRIRMQSHAKDNQVFIRSIGSRGSYGGLSRTTKEIVRLFDAFGFDVVIVETVGVGQTELSIMEVAQTSVVILVPESGDTIQTMKAGLLEIGDIFIVNKSDRPDANHLKHQLEEMIQYEKSTHRKWLAPVIQTQAIHGVGIEELWKGLKEHRDFLKSHPEDLKARRAQERKAEFMEILTHMWREQLEKKIKSGPKLKKIFEDVIAGKKDPYTASADIIKMK